MYSLKSLSDRNVDVIPHIIHIIITSGNNGKVNADNKLSGYFDGSCAIMLSTIIVENIAYIPTTNEKCRVFLSESNETIDNIVDMLSLTFNTPTYNLRV